LTVDLVGTSRIDVRGLGAGVGLAPTPQLWEVPTMLESIALVGLDVHQAQSVAAVLDPVSGELRVERLRGAPGDVVPVFLEGLGRPVRAVYEAGPTGFALAREAIARGLDLRVVSPGSIPKAPGDRVKTDRRDAKRLVRLFAAGELSFSFVPSEAEEHFRDLVRCIDDARTDLMRSRHRLSKFLLRRGLRFAGRAWTQPHQRWLGKVAFDDALSRAVLIDYCVAIDALVHRRRELILVLEDAAGKSSHAQTIARLRCFRGINTLTAAGLCAEVSPAVGVPRDRAERVHLERQTRSGPHHQGRPDARAAAAGRVRSPLPSPSEGQHRARCPPGRAGPACRGGRMAGATAPVLALGAPRWRARQADRDRRCRGRS
jgi:transposase